jgi:ankyrin repeat protein
MIVVIFLAQGREQYLLSKDRDGLLPLHHAVQHQVSPEVVQYLIRACPLSVQTKRNGGILPLHWAALWGAPTEVLESLADAYPQALMEKSDDGYLPLHLAAPASSLERVKYVVGLCPGALQERKNDGFLPVHFAAQYDAPLEVLYFLLRTWPKAVGGGGLSAARVVSDDGMH